MKDVSMLGYHTSVDNLKDLETYQVFLGSPRRYQEPDSSKLLGVDKEIVVHCPYWTQLAKPDVDASFQRTLQYIIKLSHELDKVSQRYIVVHVGSRYMDDSIAEAMNNIRMFCIKWLYATQNDNTVLCLENDSGSKKKSKMGSVRILTEIINDLNNPRIKMAFDTEHAYANGFDLQDVDRLNEIEQLVGVVHFNSIPEYVEKGSHTDRHTETSFDNSKGGFDYQRKVWDVLYDGVRPFIVEADEQFALRSIDVIRNYHE